MLLRAILGVSLGSKDNLKLLGYGQGFRFFSRSVGRSDPWSKNGGSFSEMVGTSISN